MLFTLFIKITLSPVIVKYPLSVKAFAKRNPASSHDGYVTSAWIAIFIIDLRLTGNWFYKLILHLLFDILICIAITYIYILTFIPCYLTLLSQWYYSS